MISTDLRWEVLEALRKAIEAAQLDDYPAVETYLEEARALIEGQS